MERIPDMALTADWDIMHQFKKQIFWHAQWAYKNLNPLKVSSTRTFILRPRHEKRTLCANQNRCASPTCLGHVTGAFGKPIS